MTAPLPFTLAAVSLTACATVGTMAPAPAAEGHTAELDVTVTPLAEGVWLHTSYYELKDYGRYPSNGLVVRTAEGALLIDTAWTPEQTAWLLDWAEANVGQAHGVVVTHWHGDRSAGLPEVHRRGIRSFGSARTSAQAHAHGVEAPAHSFEDVMDLSPLGVAGEVRYAGAGHTVDNVVVWLASTRVLFGGCLVRATAAENMGNVADADLPAWPVTIAALEARYPGALRVVPGHGETGGTELLAHTRALAQAAAAQRE